MTFSIKKKTLRKIVSSLTMFATVVSMSGMMAFSTVVAAEAITDGALIKSDAINSDGTPTYESLDIYIVKTVGTKDFKRLVLNPTVFESYGHLNYGDVQTVSQAVMDTYTTASLVRVDTDLDEKVYVMAPDGDLGSKSWVNLTTAEATSVTGYDADSVYTINEIDGGNYNTVGDVTTPAELTIFYSNGTLPSPVPVAGDLTVALSATTPVSTTLVQGQATAHLADFVFTGSGNVTSVELSRVGVSQDSTLANVYLFSGDTRLTDAASVSSGTVNFASTSGLFTVDGTTTISVKSDIAGSTSGETVGVELIGATLESGSVAGFPVSANTHSIASADLAAVTVGAPLPSSVATTDPTTDVRVWESTFSITTRDVEFSKLALRQINSIEKDDIENFRLLVDGTEVATQANLDANGYVTFSGFTKTLTSGNRTVKVLADVIGGSSRIIQMSLRNEADVDVLDSEYGVNVAVSGPIPASTSTLTVNSGTMTVVKATDSPSGNVTTGASNVLVGKYTLTAYGEAIKVETLNVAFDVDNADDTRTLRNVMIMVDGSQVGSTTSVPAADAHSASTSFTTNFIVEPGTLREVEIYTDIYDNEGVNDIVVDSKIQAALTVGSANGSRQVSLGTVNVPTATQAANEVTVATGSMTLAATASYPNQTTVVPQAAYKMGSWSLSGSSTEDINIHTLSLDIDEITGTTFSEADLTDMYITYGGNTTTIKSTASAVDNDWSINYTLAKNDSIVIELFASIGATITAADSVKTDLSVSGTGADSTTAISQLDKDGQTITYQAGSIVATRDASTANAVIVDDSGEVATASYKFEAIYDNYTITEVVVAVSDATAVANVILRDGTTVLATKPGATAVTFSGLSVPVSNNNSKVLDVYIELSAVGVGAGISGAAITTDYTSAKAIAGSTGVEANITDTTTAGNAIYVYKAVPTITNVNLPSGVLGTGTQTLAKFTIASSGGTIAWKELMFDIAKNGLATSAVITSPTLWDVTSGSAVQVTATALFQHGTSADTTCSATDTACELVMTVGTKANDNVEEQISGSKTYEVRATVTGTIADNDYINTNISQNSSFVASNVFTSVDNDTNAANVTFTWSDVSAQSHDTGTSDWTSDYLVSNLATDTQNLVK